MIIRTAICDTDKGFAEFLRNCILHCKLYDHSHDIRIYHDDLSILDDYSWHTKCNIAFINIDLPHMSGADLVKLLNQSSDSFIIPVFYGKYPEYMCDTLDIHPYYYFQKTDRQSVIKNLLNRLFSEQCHYFSHPDKIFVNGKDYYKGDDSIIYVDCSDSRQTDLVLHTTSRTICISSQKLSTDVLLASPLFFNCGNGIIVNLIHISGFSNSTLFLDNNEILSLPPAVSRDIRHQHLQYAFPIRKRFL